MAKFFRNIFLGTCLMKGLFAVDRAETAFTRVYQQARWGRNQMGKGCSGLGSTLEGTEEYRAFLQKFLEDRNIHSVIDVGCGDWEFSRAIDWGSIDYTGYDVVRELIENNRKRFSSSHITFVHGDGVRSDLPGGDLLLCKDVLQHLPNQEIWSLIEQFGKFKYCLITNDVGDRNRDIFYGAYRPLDITAPPFSVEGSKVLTYSVDNDSKVVTKQVVLIENR